MSELVFSGKAVNPTVRMVPGSVLQEKQLDEPPGVMNIVVPKGNTKTVPLTLSINGYDALDLTGASIKFTAKMSPSDPQGEAVIEKTNGDGITIVSATDGQITVDFIPADTADAEELLPITFDIEVTTSTSEVYTVQRGVLTITNRVSS